MKNPTMLDAFKKAHNGMGPEEYFKKREAEKANPTFKIGDQCHYDNGSDIYAVEVSRVEATKIYTVRLGNDRQPVAGDKTELVFTKRRDGKFRRLGWENGELTPGFNSYRDPSF